MSVLTGIDINALMDAACKDLSIAKELLKLFFELTGQEQTRLSAAAAQGDAPTASAVAHKIAGSCSACGMSELAARFRELERLCKGSLPDDLNERLQSVYGELQNIRHGLEEYFNCSFAP